MMRAKRVYKAAALALVPLLLSCNLLTPLVFIGEHKKKVSAEFDKLANKRVVVLVWTKQSTLFDYPYARLELAAYVGDKLFSEMAQRKLDVEVVNPLEVEDHLQRRAAARTDPVVVGKAFDADYVIYLEVLEFQFRDPQQPQFLQGRIQAAVAVHDVRADPDMIGRTELSPVQCIHPEGAPVLMSATNAPLVREATYQKFAEMVARKFYEHTVDL